MKQKGATEPSILSIRRGLAEKVKLSGYDDACTTITQGRNAMYKEYTRPLEQQIDTDKNIFSVLEERVNRTPNDSLVEYKNEHGE